jgi:hypothetical protein
MSSVSVVIVQRDGNLKSLKITAWNAAELYKRAGFKSEKDFVKHCDYRMKAKTHTISLYGKTNGKANTENKYDFPPPVDETLFFGNCILVKMDRETNEPTDLTIAEWESTYEYLFGGFDDLTGGGMGMIVADALDRRLDEMEMDEEEKRIMNDPNTKFTKNGYVKDGFIVDDDEDDEDYQDDSDESDDDSVDSMSSEEKKPTKKKSSAKTAANPRRSKSGAKKSQTDPENSSDSSNTPSESNTSESIEKDRPVESVLFSFSGPVDNARPFHANKSSKGKMISMKDKANKRPKSTAKPKVPRAPRKKTVAPAKSALDQSLDRIEMECKDELVEEEYFK